MRGGLPVLGGDLPLEGPPYRGTRVLVGELRARIRRHPDRGKIERALRHMVDLHLDQKDRPDGTPYVSHPLDVALQVIDDVGCTDADMVVAALLHDSVEDQAEKLGGNLESALDTLVDRYGRRVAELVRHLTNPDFEELVLRRWPGEPLTRGRKNQLYLEHVQHIAETDLDAFAIKLCDFSCNALRLENVEDPQRRQKLEQKYAPVVDFIVDFLRQLERGGGHPLHERRSRLSRRFERAQKDYAE